MAQLSRYIHRNPIDMKRPLVDELADYPWSSYPAYVNKTKTPDWLHRDRTYQALGHKQRFRGYAAYVMQGVDEDLLSYYQNKYQPSVIGDDEFYDWVYNTLLPELEAEKRGKAIRPDISMDDIVTGISRYKGVTVDSLLRVVKGPAKGKESRKIAMYLCQEMAAARLVDIASIFNLGHAGSVSFITHQIRKRKKEDRHLASRIDSIVESIMKQAT